MRKIEQPSPGHKEELNEHLAALGYRQSRASLPGASVLTIFAAVICADVTSFQLTEHFALLVWLSLMLASYLFRYLLLLHLQHAPSQPQKIWLQLWVWGSWLNALGWGLLAYFFLPQVDSKHQTFLLLIITGIGAGAISSLSPFPTLFRVYLFLLLAPLTLRFIFLAQEYWLYGLMAATTVLYLFFVLRSGSEVYEALASSITMGLENKKLVSRLEEAVEAATAANRQKSQFLANMSHEIRTPMNAVIGMTHLALEESSTPKQHHVLKTAYQSAQSLLGIINDILDFSKIEAGQLQLNLRAFQVQQFLKPLADIIAVSAREKGLKFTLDLAPDLPPTVIGDDLRIHQILLNLVGNAIKFTSSGSVVLQVELLAKRQTPGKVPLHFSVTDTGIGIAPDKLEAIFNTFEQADNSYTRQFGGTGLGLAISKQLTTLMGGHLWAESSLGQGSTFHLTLELEACEEAPKPSITAQSETAEPAQRQLTLLVVDDNEVNRDVASMMLEKDHQVQAAADGLEALQKISATSFDLVLMDVQMPVMDGLTATQLIREIESGNPPATEIDQRLLDALTQRLEGSHISIVAITAHATTEDREMCLAAGMDAYLTKPIQPDQLNTFLQRYTASPTGRQ